ncbi:MAG: polysaccharide biosynthesis/export family protein [Hyphomicrobium sp.]
MAQFLTKDWPAILANLGILTKSKRFMDCPNQFGNSIDGRPVAMRGNSSSIVAQAAGSVGFLRVPTARAVGRAWFLHLTGQGKRLPTMRRSNWVCLTVSLLSTECGSQNMYRVARVVDRPRLRTAAVTSVLAVIMLAFGIVEARARDAESPNDLSTADGKLAVKGPISSATTPRLEPAYPTIDLKRVEIFHVRVRGQPDLSGEYRVNPDVTVSIAGIGRIAVGAFTPSQFEQELSRRLSIAMHQDTSVSVEIVRYRPFYLTGQVAEPGAMEWRPGLTVIQAISLAGGVYRLPMQAEMATVARGLGLQQAKVQRKFALATLARLKAEKAGHSGVEATDMPDFQIGELSSESRQSLETFMAQQNALLQEQRKLTEARLEGLERERQSATSELNAATVQSNEVKKQVDLMTEVSRNVESMRQQKLIDNSRYLQLSRDAIDANVRYSESLSLIERARGRLLAIASQIETVSRERNTILNERIEALEREVAQLNLTLADGAFNGASSAEAVPEISYNIARKSDTGVDTISANLVTEILPGDVVIVTSKPPSAGGQRIGASVGDDADKLLAIQRIMEASATRGPAREGSMMDRQSRRASGATQ